MTDVERDAFLDRLQKAAFGYFVENVNEKNGLIADTSRAGSPCSIAVTGFGLAAYIVGVERRWMAREKAAALTLAALRFFRDAGKDPNIGYRGFFFHFLDMQTGKRVWDCELSMVDTALLIAGILSAACYFTGTNAAEKEIAETADILYRRVDWKWARNNGVTLSQGWKPEAGFLHYGWEGYNEAAILYLLALASPTHPPERDTYKSWAATYQWENIYGYDVLYAGPMFIHQFSHAWVDFRGIRDAFMREKKFDYFENSRNAVEIQREYARLNPMRFDGYGGDCWGLSACDGPGNRMLHVGGRDRRCYGYAARGAPFGPDDGTFSPPTVAASLPFAPDAAIAALKHILDTYPYAVKDFRLPASINPSAGKDGKAWVAEGHFGLDQGIVLLMIENFRSGLMWELMKKCPYISAGLKHAGFAGSWLGG